MRQLPQRIRPSGRLDRRQWQVPLVPRQLWRACKENSESWEIRQPAQQPSREAWMQPLSCRSFENEILLFRVSQQFQSENAGKLINYFQQKLNVGMRITAATAINQEKNGKVRIQTKKPGIQTLPKSLWESSQKLPEDIGRICTYRPSCRIGSSFCKKR